MAETRTRRMRVISNFDADRMRTVSAEEQLKCAKREFAMRRVNYPKWVNRGTMGQAEATREMEAMGAIIETLKTLAAQQSLFP